MSDATVRLPKLAVVYGALPLAEEVDQLALLAGHYEVSIVTSNSIGLYLQENCTIKNLTCLAVPDYDEQATFLPGLEQALEPFDVVIVKERIGLCAYQALKAKWRYRFRLIIWADNITPFLGEDTQRLRTIRSEIKNGADAFFVQTEAAAECLELEGVNRERIFQFLPWVKQSVERSEDQRRTQLQRLGLHETNRVIYYYGDVEWVEGLSDLLHAVALLLRRQPSLQSKLKVIISGIGSYSNELKQRGITLGIDQNIMYVVPHVTTHQVLLQVCDFLYFGQRPAPELQSADPHRYLSAMVNGVPVLASRSPIVEATVEKQRLDYCPSSFASLSDAIAKGLTQKGLVHNLVKKNQARANTAFNESKARASMLACLGAIAGRDLTVTRSAIDHLVVDVEAQVAAKQYLNAIDLIESIFRSHDVPVHHRANLFRLIGDCFAKLGDKESGKSAYLQAIDLDPFSARAHIGLGTISLMRQNFDIGVIHFQKAVSLAPADEMANLGLGLSFQGLDELNEASKWIVKSLQINPDNTAAIFSLVKIAHEREVFGEAISALQTYLYRHPDDHNLRYTLGGILYKLDKYHDVIEVIEPVLQHDPMDSRAQGLIKQAKRAMERQSQTSAG